MRSIAVVFGHLLQIHESCEHLRLRASLTVRLCKSREAGQLGSIPGAATALCGGQPVTV